MTKLEQLKDLLKKYKELISLNKLKDEKYKWELLHAYKSKPNLDAPNFELEILDVNYQNLVYYNAKAVLHNMVNSKPKKTKQILEVLFNEQRDLKERIEEFQQEFLQMYREAEPHHELAHHQDERTISCYLAVKYPDKYPFYKYSFYRRLCDYLNEKPASKGEQYIHYIKLNKELADFIRNDEELTNLVSKFLGEYKNEDPNNLLLAQDVLYQVFEKNEAKEIEKVQADFNEKEFDFYIEWLRNITAKFSLPYEDERVTYNVRDKRLIFTVVQRYSAVLFKQSNKTYLNIISTEKETENFEEFAGTNPNPFLNVFSFEEREKINIENHYLAIENELKRTTKSSFKKDENIDLKNLVYNLEESQQVKNSTPTFKEVIEEVASINSAEKEYLFQNNKVYPRYTWIGDSYGVIGNKRAHYEIQMSGDRDTYVLVHFEDEYCKKIKELIGNDLPKYMDWYDWEKGEGIRVKGFEMLKEPGTPNMLYNKLKYLEENLGDRIRKALKQISIKDNNMNSPLNKILYGPPGTGKTYKTKELAVNIALGEKKRKRDEVLNLYDDLVKKEKVCFTTFHQSMSYEDFVEGIKPETNEENNVVYTIQDGIFKTACTNALKISTVNTVGDQIDFTTKTFFKMSLGGKNRKDIHNWCIENNYISLGWGGNNDYSVLSNYKHWDSFKENFIKQFPDLDADSSFNKQAMYCFQHWMKVGDIVIVTLGNNIVDAIGIVEGEYEFDENKEIAYNHFRKVRWLATNLNASPKLFIDKNISQQTIYKFSDEDIKLESFEEKFSPKKNEKLDVDNNVLIIDEINRGNVSAIFGELITLIEEDKRKGCKEEINLTLPYSKELFSVPNNLYIIGTMNTADRSVEALDTALRRRFSFEELLPNPSLLADLAYKEVNLEQLLDTINQRIEILIDKDHQIGHSYFFTVQSLNDLKLVFQDKIFPLLEEYFYGDYGKIGLVLGESFIAEKTTQNKNVLASFQAYSDVDFITDKKIFKLKDISNMTVADFKSIYETVQK